MGIQDAAAELESLCQTDAGNEMIESALQRLAAEIQAVIDELAAFVAQLKGGQPDKEVGTRPRLIELQQFYFMISICFLCKKTWSVPYFS